MFSTAILSAGLNAVGDFVLPVAPGEDMFVGQQGQLKCHPAYKHLFLALATGDALSRANINAPSLRNLAPWEISPVIPPADINDMTILQHQSWAPVGFTPGESITGTVTKTAAAADVNNIIAFFSDGMIEKVRPNKLVHAHATVPNSTVINQWVTLDMTIETTLAAGKWALCGARVQNPNLLAYRFAPVEAPLTRPGGIPVSTAIQQMDNLFRNGCLGRWFSFSYDTPPKIQVFNDAPSGGNLEILLDLYFEG